MQVYKVGDKVHIAGNDGVFTIGRVYNAYFYSLDEQEVAHFYLMEPNYENIYFIGDLRPASI